jgi:hypothetical protein
LPLAFCDFLKYYRLDSEYVVVCASNHEKSGNRDLAATCSSLIGGLWDWGDQNRWQEFFDTYWKLITAIPQKIEEKCWLDDLNLPHGRDEKQKTQTNTFPV